MAETWADFASLQMEANFGFRLLAVDRHFVGLFVLHQD
jgi:hypothetical protein